MFDIKTTPAHRRKLYRLVGKTGFEPAAPWSQTMCSAKLSYFPIVNGAPERSRTPNLLISSQTLYPIELRALNNKMVRPRGLEPPRGHPHYALNLARLPIPPRPHYIINQLFRVRVEGFEPPCPKTLDPGSS